MQNIRLYDPNEDKPIELRICFINIQYIFFKYYSTSAGQRVTVVKTLKLLFNQK